MDKKNLDKIKKITNKSILIASGILIPLSPTTTFAATNNINFPLSTLQEQTKSIALPSNFDSVTSISVDNGDVSYSVSNGQLNINVKNGTPVSSDSVLNPTKYNKPATTFLYSRANDLPLTTPYSDEDGFSGTLNKDGAAYVESGSLIPGESKTVTDKQISPDPNYFPNVLDYNYGGYTGTLSKNGAPIKTKIDGDSFVQDKKTGSDSIVKNGSITTPYKFKFDGSTYIQLPTSLNTVGENNSDMTVEGWFEISPTGGSEAIYGLNGTNTINDNNIIIGVWNDQMHINPRNGGTGNDVSGGTVERGKKVHLTFVIENNVGKLYLNGTLIKSQSILPRIYTYEEGPKLGMEFDNWVTSDYFDGYMHEVRIYNRSLSQTEVNNNKNGSVTRTSLVGEYLFDTGSGTTIYDTSGKGNHGKVVGSANWEGTPTAPAFQNTVSYDDGSYAGTLNKSGSPILTSQTGIYTPAVTQYLQDVRTNTTNVFPNSISYNSGGVSATLYKSGIARAADSKVVTGQNKISRYKKDVYVYTEAGWQFAESLSSQYPFKYYYSDKDGYFGWLDIKETDITIHKENAWPTSKSIGDIFIKREYTRYYEYEGTVTRLAGTTRTTFKETKVPNYETAVVLAKDINIQPDYSPTESGYWTQISSVDSGVKYIYIYAPSHGRFSPGYYVKKTGGSASTYLNAGGWLSQYGDTWDFWDYYNNHSGSNGFDSSVTGLQFKTMFITNWTWTAIERDYTQHYSGINTTNSGSDTRVVKYQQNYSGDVVRYITPTVTVGNIDNNFAASINYVDRSGFKGTISKSGTATQSSDGQYVQNYSGRVYSQTFDNTSYEYTQYYTGTVSNGDIDTRIWRANYSGTAYKGEYEPANEKYVYNVVVNYSVMSGSATCSYKHISPPSTTVSNYVPKCITVTKPNNDLYKMLYNFSVTGISVAGDR